jgi:hypothetical protein
VPGDTRFRVRLPLTAPAREASAGDETDSDADDEGGNDQ